jgi:O-succinylbenzoic acid--CoA ligase
MSFQLSPRKWLEAGSESLLALNPRMPEAQAQALREAWREAGEAAFPGHAALATSGTSGSSPQGKLVAISRGAIEASARAVNASLQASPGDIWLKSLPDFHVGGLGIYARAALAGATVIESPLARWDAVEFARVLGERRATLVSLVPAQVFDLARARLRAPPSLRAALVGGGALAQETYAAARALAWPLLPSYGLSECASTVAVAPLVGNSRAPVHDSLAPVHDSLASVHDSLASVHDSLAPLARAELGRRLMPDLELLPHVKAAVDGGGRLLLKSAALFSGYVLLEGGRPRAVDPKRDGWFASEDRALIDGYILRPLGRDQDFLKIGGEQSSLARLEEIFERARLAQDSGSDASLVALEDERLGWAIHLLCAGRDLVAIEPIRRAYDLAVHPYERVRSVCACEAVPRSPLGKVLRAEARALFPKTLCES